MTIKPNVDEMIAERAKEVADFLAELSKADMPNDNAGVAPLRQRQILMVDKVYHFTSGYQISTTGGRGAGNTLRFFGQPSPSSQIKSGYMTFVPAAQVRTPTYNDDARELRLWVNIDGLPQVLEQLTHKDRFLWIGWFPGGHVFAELHSAS